MKMSDWKPIDTAPKDGTKILLYEDGIIEGYFEVNEKYIKDHKAWGGEGYWKSLWTPEHGCGCCGDDNEPTHWMPLPKGPRG